MRFERTSGRTGPGAGRLAKLFRRRHDELSVSVPDRDYELAGCLLAAGVADAIRTGGPVEAGLGPAARAAARRVGEGERPGRASPAVDGAVREDPLDVVTYVLGRHGYEPRICPSDEVALANCPFYRLAEQQRSLICGMNLDFVSGIIDGIGATDGVAARLAPEQGYCCVCLTPA